MEPTGRCVLLVEDDPNDQLLMRRAFRKAGVEARVDTVEDGDAAIEFLSRRSSPPVLVLLDLKLPRRSGLEVLAWAKGQEATRRIPIVVFTSSAEIVDLTRAYDLGANSYLVKPTSSEELTRLITSVTAYWLDFNRPPPASSEP